jgi:HSP20 family protein
VSRQDASLVREDVPLIMSPFALLQRFFSDDITGLLGDFGRRRAGIGLRPAGGTAISWAPKIDVVQQGNELVVRADLPGMKADDVVVEVTGDTITISGERQQERTEEHHGVYRYERTYGSFFREIPLPEGTIAEQAKATFKDGVLEITVPAPPEQVSRGRRLEIGTAQSAGKGESTKERGGRPGDGQQSGGRKEGS